MTETERPVLTIREAADAAGVSIRTLRRRLAAGAFPNAAQDPTDALSPWLIPVEDLIAAGFTLHASTPEPAPAPTVGHDDDVAQLRAEVVELRHRVELAEAVAAERSARIEDLSLALRALAAGAPVEVEHTTDEPKRRRRRFW